MVSAKKTKTPGRRYLGEILVKSGLIDQGTLDKALEIQKSQGKKLGQVLIGMGVADDVAIAKALADQLAIPLISLSETTIPGDIISLVPAELVKIHNVIPVSKKQSKLSLAMADPLDFYAVDDVRFATQLHIEPVVAPEHEIIFSISKYYPETNVLKTFSIDEKEDKNENDNAALTVYVARKGEEEETAIEDLRDLSDRPPIVRFTNAIIDDAIKLNASDIHIEPRRNAVIVRYRIDGVMREIMKTERNVHLGIVTRIKAISKMDISNRRVPQDGKLQVSRKKSLYDLRVSTLPTAYGEKVTIRLLNVLGTPDSIEDLNFSKQALADLKDAISQPQGIVLVTGPTGSGKTTTLYTCLKTLMKPEVNIVTLENPIEYDIEGINQVEINPAAGLTFASGLRSILRQDPDIILLGEIRDEETAGVAFNAAETGRLVLATLHTNSALVTISRLMDLGVDPFNIGSSLNAVIAQRLVRRICEKCRNPDDIGDDLRKRLPEPFRGRGNASFWKGAGCNSCGFTGYSGRVGISEVLRVNTSIQKLIRRNAPVHEIEVEARSRGFQTLSVDGIAKAAMGLTSISEIFRIAPPPVENMVEDPGTGVQLVDEPGAEEQPAGDLSVPVASITPRRILIVEDNEFMLRLIQGVLEGEGYITITAVDGEEALRIALKEVPDLIVTDYLMPEMDGITLIRKLRSTMATMYIPVIILTIRDELELEVQGIDAGADDFLVKPINARKLVSRVNRLLRKRFDN